MGQHLRGRLGPAGRIELARLQVDLGMSERAAAAALSVSSRTARRWKLRRRSATAAELASGEWALGRSSRPRRSPARSASELEQRVCAERERSGHGPRLIAGRMRKRMSGASSPAVDGLGGWPRLADGRAALVHQTTVIGCVEVRRGPDPALAFALRSTSSWLKNGR